jgi:methyl-accepting chemotaxis protein
VKLNNLTIAPKLGILVGVALLGLCVADGLAGYLMQQEMVNSRVDEINTIVDMARNLAIGLQKEVDAGKLSKEAAMAEFERIGNMLTYDHRNGYLFGTTMDSITVPSQVGQNRMDLLVNGRSIAHEWHDGIAAKGEHTLIYWR